MNAKRRKICGGEEEEKRETRRRFAKTKNREKRTKGEDQGEKDRGKLKSKTKIYPRQDRKGKGGEV